MGQKINVGEIEANLSANSSDFEKGLAQGRAALNAIDKEMEVLEADFRQGAIATQQFADRQLALASVQQRIAAAMQQAYQATTNFHTGLEVVNAQAGMMTRQAGNMGYALMQLGAIVDDVQYGFTGVVNNIGPLIYGLSGSMSIAAGAQIAAVGVFQLYKHWDDLRELFGDLEPMHRAESTLEGIRKKVQELRKEVEGGIPWAKDAAKLEELEAKLEKLQKAESAVKQMESMLPEDAKKAQARFAQGIAERGKDGKSGFDVVSEQLAQDRFRKNGAESYLIPEDAERFYRARDEESRIKKIPADQRDISEMFMLRDVEEKRKGLQAKALRKAQEETKRELGEAMIDPEKREELTDYLERHDAKYGDLGQVLAGKSETKKETKEREEKDEKEREKKFREKERVDKQDRHISELFRKDAIESARKQQQEKEAADRENDQAEDEGRRELDRQRKDRVDRAKKLVPGLDKIAEQATTFAQIGGGNQGDVRAQLSAMLQARGMKERDAARAAGDIASEAGDKVQGQLVDRMLDPEREGREGQEQQKPSRSETFDAAELATRAQSGVNNEQQERKEQTNILKDSLDMLRRIAEAKGQNALTVEIK